MSTGDLATSDAGISGDDAVARPGIPPRGYRLPDETRLGMVRLQVADLDRSLAYYQTVLGFRVINRSEAGASLGALLDEMPLVELVEQAGASPVPRRGRLGLFHFAILLPDRSALGRFVAHLATLGVTAGASDHRVSEALYLSDPDGLGIEVYADRPRASWRRNGPELVMDTKPLDTGALARAAGGERWTGMPPGTVIGHVHLHVGDLDEAATFFHQALGFDAMVWSYPGALFLSAGGYHHHLGVNTWAVNAVPPRPSDACLLEWVIVTPKPEDAKTAARNIEAAGYRVMQSEAGWVVTDPWGTPLRLV